MNNFTAYQTQNSYDVVIPRTAKDALDRSFDYYYSPEPCEKAGHIGHRIAKNGKCKECAQIASEKRRETDKLIRKRKMEQKFSDVRQDRLLAEQTKEVWE